MDDDDLRAVLASRDPAADLPAEGDTPEARARLERIMSTPVETRPAVPGRSGPRARWLVPVGGLAAAAALVVGVLVTRGPEVAPAREAVVAALTLPDPLAASSCLVFDTATLAQAPVAFAGTVTSLTPDVVTLDVTRWYRGSPEATQVRLDAPSPDAAALDGTAFTDGGRYLVTASADGTVNGCGYSGAESPELTRAFDEAFAG